MKVEIKDAEYSQKELLIEIPYDDYLVKENEQLNKLAPTVSLPGFRKGKAPKEVVRKQFAHRLKSQTLEKVINESANAAIKENNLKVINKNFYIVDNKFEENKPLTFTIRVEVFPSLDSLKYENYEFEKVEIKISDDDINKELDLLRDGFKTLEPVEGREAKLKDVANIDFVGFLDGKEFPNGSGKSYDLNLGSGTFINGFEDGVVGMKVGETKDINLTFPEDYHADLAGKDVVFKVTLNSLKEYVLPELDDDFAKEAHKECETIKDLKKYVKKGLEIEYGKLSTVNSLTEALNKIIADNEVPVPLSVVKERAEALTYNALNQYFQSGIDPRALNINVEELAQSYYPMAETQAKQSFVISEIARKENIEVSDEDYDKFVKMYADLHGTEVETLKSDIEKNKQKDIIYSDILGGKVYDFLTTKNKVNVKSLTSAEYMESKKNAKEDVQKIEL